MLKNIVMIILMSKSRRIFS